MEPFAVRFQRMLESYPIPLAVGIDPHPDRLPSEFRFGSSDRPDLEGYVRAILELLAGRVGLVKFQVAFFEQWGPEGYQALWTAADLARELGLMTIADAKRGDIASTAEAYAQAFLPRFDALTVNPYLGPDSVEPFRRRSRDCGCGLFVLVRTSNPAAGEYQDVPVDGGFWHEHIARSVAQWAGESCSETGYGDVGAVVAPIAPEQMKRLRDLMPESIFLIPGLGHQGGTGESVAAGFHPNGQGAFTSASRSILFPKGEPEDWRAAVVSSLEQTQAEVRTALRC